MQVEEKVQGAGGFIGSWEQGTEGARPAGGGWPEQCVYRLGEAEREEVRGLCDELPAPKMRALNDLSLWERFKVLSGELPRGLRHFLAGFELRSNGYGFVVVRGLPADDKTPPTPYVDEAFAQYRLSTFAKAAALTGARFGYPLAYRDEKGRLVMQPVYPRKDDAYKQENSSSGSFLEGHTEDGFLREYCQWLLLACVRPDHEKVARTGVACAWQAVQHVEWNVIDVLRQPRYVVEAPSSFGGDVARPLTSDLLPVLTGDMRRPLMVFDVAAMRGEDPQSREALRQFNAALQKVHVSGALEAGDCLLVDNQTSVHTRSTFLPRFDGRDRWLLRLKLFSNPRASAASRLPDSLMCGSIAFDLAPRP